MMRLFGLTMKPGLQYSYTDAKYFIVSGVAIENGEEGKIYLNCKGVEFVVATLNKKNPQASLDLRFCYKDNAAFKVKGDATVSLTGLMYHDRNEWIAAGAKAIEKVESPKVMENIDDLCLTIKIGGNENKDVTEIGDDKNKSGEKSEFPKSSDEKEVDSAKDDIGTLSPTANAKKDDCPSSGVAKKQKKNKQKQKILIDDNELKLTDKKCGEKSEFPKSSDEKEIESAKDDIGTLSPTANAKKDDCPSSGVAKKQTKNKKCGCKRRLDQ